MACQIQTEQYTSVVLKLITLDPTKYNSFNNAAAFILQSGLTPEQKMLSVHNIAYIYNGLAGLEDFYKPGMASDILDVGKVAEDPESYLKTVTEMLGVTPSAKLSIDTLNKKIEALGSKSTLTRKDLVAPEGILTMMGNYFAVTKFDTAEDRNEVLTQLTAALKEQIMEFDMAADHRDFLLRQVDDTAEGLRQKSDYIPLSAVPELGVVNYDNALNANAGEMVLFEDAFLSNFTIKAVNKDERATVLRKLENMEHPSANIRIFAVKNSDSADQFVQRVQNAAVADPNLRKLGNRKHETYESVQQQRFLQSTPNGKVMTVSRPKLEDESFQLVGEIVGTGEQFLLYPATNYAFVSSDNTTELVDFGSKGHLELIKQLAVKSTFLGKAELTDNDVNKIAAAAVQYQAFKQKIGDRVDNQFEGGEERVDITSDFFANYDVTTKRGERKKTTLAAEMESNPAISKAVEVAVVDDAGNVISSEARNLAFYYTRYNARDQWRPVSFLRRNERILVKNAAGEMVALTQEQYADQVLELNTASINNLLSTVDSKQNNIIIRFGEGGKLGYNLIDPARTLDKMEEFATFMIGLAEALSSANKATAIDNFDNYQYTFRRSKDLYINLKPSAKGQLQIELRPAGAGSKYAFINEKGADGKKKYQGAFNFPIDETLIINAARSLKGQGPLVQKIKQEFPVLGSLDMNKNEDVYKFYEMVNTLAGEATPHPLIKELADKVAETADAFSKSLANAMFGNIEEKTAAAPQFMELLRQDYTNKDGKFVPEQMIMAIEDNGKMTPKIEYSPKYKPVTVDAKERLRVNMNNYKVLSSDYRRLAVVPKTAIVETAASEAAPIAAPIDTIATETPISTIVVDELDEDLPEIDAFSIAEGEVEYETESDRLQQAEWLRQSLPQLGIAPEFTEDLASLASIEGTVLGVFKDKMIYLNKALAGKGVLYHEAFHGVFRYLMTEEQRNNLIAEVRKNKSHAGKFTDAALKEFARKRNLVYNRQEMSRLQAEEILADGFQNYMNKNTKPKGVIAQFMQMLKKLLEFFVSNKSYIEGVYGDIRRGAYKHAAVQSGIFDGQVVYELIPGLKKVVNDQGRTGIKSSVLGVSEQQQLVSMFTSYLLEEENTRESFDQRFERIAKKLIDEVYNLDKIIAANPGMEAQIREKAGERFANYQFMLGARMFGRPVYDINATSEEKYNNKTLKNTVKLIGETEGQDNSNGAVSYNILKKIVKKELAVFNSLLDKAESSVSKEVLDAAKGEESTVAKSDSEILDRDEVPADSFDEGFNEVDRLESMPRMIRKFLALTRYDQVDPELGVSFPRVVSGAGIFSQLLKISSDIAPEHIVQNIIDTADMHAEDGNFEISQDLRAVYDHLKQYTGLDDAGVPSRQKQVFNMLVDVLHGTELDYVMFNVYSDIADRGENMTEFKVTGISITDRVLSEDINKKKKDIIASVITTHASKANTSEYKAAVTKLTELVSTHITGSNDMLTSVKYTADDQLKKITDELHSTLKTLGMTFPKSMIRMSLLAIEERENNNTLKITGKALSHYRAHEKFVQEKKYLERDFFFDIVEIFNLANSSTHNEFANLLDDKSKDKTIGRMNRILGKASAYLAKYDPVDLPSVVRNAEGKMIYRYVKYTPLLTVAQDLRTKGLVETIMEDPYAKELSAFIQDNRLLGDLMEGKDTPMARRMKLLLDNMQLSMFGGIQQSVNDKRKEGKGFKDIDDRSMYLLNIMLFLNRNTLTSYTNETQPDGTVKRAETTIETFQRSFTQLESSGTNFLMTGVYMQYADKLGLIKDKEGNLKIVQDLEAVIRQEYNRIAREFANFEENKELYARGENNFVNKVNAVKDKDGTIRNRDSKGNLLRAYKFQKLADFFKSAPGFEEALIQFAEEGEEFDKIDRSSLRKTLNDFALKNFQAHLDMLEKADAIQKKIQPRRKGKGAGEESGNDILIPGTDKPANPYVYYTSSLLPKVITMPGTDPVKLSDRYRTFQNNDAFGEPMEPQLDMQDVIADAYFNYWANSLHLNDLFDGDVSMNVKDGTDYFKRQKKNLASGSNMKRGEHRVAYIDTVEGFVSRENPKYGTYYSKEEIENDTRLSREQKDAFLAEYGKKGTMFEIFDGQSYSLIMHQMDMFDTLGRLSSEAAHLLIAKHYRPLDESEVRILENNKIVLNAKKTVTSARNSYHKLSELNIDRNFVSVLNIPEGMKRSELYDQLHAMHAEIFSLRAQRNEARLVKDMSVAEEAEAKIQKIAERIHSYYTPYPGREVLHHLLNAMEYYQVDQIMDTTASKNATKLPVNLFDEISKVGPGKYVNLPVAAVDVQNKFKYLQVETSGVKDEARYSVQAKALAPADLLDIEEIIDRSGQELTASERKSVEKITGILENYQKTMRDVAESNLINLKNTMRDEEGNIQIGKVFDLVRESLASQGAPDSDQKLFETDAEGNPRHSANLPRVRNVLEFYLFSLYSKIVTDEKGAGGKSIHVSSLGHKVLENEDGTIVFTEEYQKNPSKYPNVKPRELGISVEEKDGVKIYYVEAIIPKPFFKSRTEERFWKENLSKFFGTRIPTEDKRSMVVIKVVDFMDSSQMNSIVLPHIVHALAGSDFDVDALYYRMQAYYNRPDNTPVKYGDYSAYDSVEEGKFVEYINYQAQDDDLNPLIKNRMNAIKEEGSFTPSENTLSVLYMSGFDQSDFEGVINLAELRDEYDALNEGITEARAERKVEKEAYLEAVFRTELDPSDRDAWRERKRLGSEIFDLKEEINELTEERNAYGLKISRAKRFAFAAMKMEATLRVMQEFGMPVSLENFTASDVYTKSVRPAFQNKNLDALMDILTNEAVFNRLYIKERSSTEAIEAIADAFGINVDDFGSQFNQYTIDAVVTTKSSTSMYKDGIGITANSNKFMALSSQYQAELAPENIIWSFLTPVTKEDGTKELQRRTYKNFGTINEEGKRVIEMIGNILGMFADAAKKPIPAALYMNEVNAPTTMAMIGVGMKPSQAVAFNLLPEVRKAVENVQRSSFALTETMDSDNLFLSNAIGIQLAILKRKNKEDVNALKKNGLLTQEGDIDTSKLIMDFQAKLLDPSLLAENKLSSKEIGFKMAMVEKAEDGKALFYDLTETQQRIVLLTLFKKQSAQTFDLLRAGSMMNLFKKLNPSTVVFDKMMGNIRDLRFSTRKLFTDDTIDRMFGKEQIWPVLYEAMEDLEKQLNRIFIERGQLLSNIMRDFGQYYSDPKNVAKTVAAYVGIRQYLMTMPGSRQGSNETMNELIAQDDRHLVETFTAEHMFTNTLPQQLEEMQRKYPENKFLQLLRAERTDNKATTKDGKIVYEKSIRMINKGKLNTEFAKEVYDDADKLAVDENMFVKQLFYHGLVKSAMQYTPGDFMGPLNSDLLLPISERIENFITSMRDAKGDFNSAVIKLLGEGRTQEDAQNFMMELFNSLVIGAISEKKNKRITNWSGIQFKEDTGFIQKLNMPAGSTKAQRLAKAAELLTYVTGQGPDGSQNVYQFSYKDPATKRVMSKMEIDMNKPAALPEATLDSMISLGYTLGIRFDYNTEQYKFPLILKVQGKAFLLNSVTDKEGVESSIANSLLKSGSFSNIGKTAVYVPVNDNLLTSTISTVAMPMAEAQKYQEYLLGQARLDYTPVAETIAKRPITSFKGKMTFAYGTNKRAGVVADTTFDAILNGERTATTRYASEGSLDYWKQAKEGSRITWEAADGRTVDVIVTKALAPLEGSGKTAEQWSKLEGWSVAYFNSKVRPRLSEAWQIEYKLATPTNQPVQPAAPVAQQPATINIYSGTGENADLSNFAFRPFKINYGGSVTEYDSVEQAFQAAKREYSEDTPFNAEIEEKILQSTSGPQIKSLGAKFYKLDVAQWNANASRIMKNFLLESFKQNPSALARLLATGNATLTHTQDKGKWGQEFPKLLMEVRAELGGAQTAKKEMPEEGVGAQSLDDILKIMKEKMNAAPAQEESASKLSSPSNPLQVYSDGSDIKGTGKIGFGAVFEHNGMLYDLSGTEESAEVKRLAELFPTAKFSNPTMEMLALVSVLNAFKNSAEHIVINQDYKGAVNYNGLWDKSAGSAQREPKPWKAKELYIQKLVQTAETLIAQIEKNGGSVNIQWVKGHSGNRMNDLADSAAKSRDIFNNFSKAFNADATQIDMENLNLTPAVIDNLYNQSSKRMSKQDFAKAAADVVATMRATSTNQQILEKIKCL